MSVLRRAGALVAVAVLAELAFSATALAMASHQGWPEIGHHRGHPSNESGVLRGLKRVHNELLGGRYVVIDRYRA